MHRKSHGSRKVNARPEYDISHVVRLPHVDLAAPARSLHDVLNIALRPYNRLLHSPSLVAIKLSVGYETRHPIGLHHAFEIGWSKYSLGLPSAPFYYGIKWQVLFTVSLVPRKSYGSRKVKAGPQYDISHVAGLTHVDLAASAISLYDVLNIAPRSYNRLLHSPSLVAIELSVGYEIRPPIDWHHAFVLGWSKYRLGLPNSQLHCGIERPLWIPNVFQTPVTVRAVQGDCEKNLAVQLPNITVR